jgi:hypothetical protein
MMTIRDSQIAILKRHAYQRFARDMLPVARRAWPTLLEDKSDESIRQLLHQAALKAAQYNIGKRRFVMRVFGIMLICGNDFETSDRGASISALLRRKMPLDEKFRLVDDQLLALLES